MSHQSFIPDLQAPKPGSAPYFEDSKQLGIPGRGSEKSPEKLQQEIVKLLSRLDAFNIYFSPGQFPTTPTRYGYRISFQYAGAKGRIDIAALPLRHETRASRTAALVQALFLFRDKTEAQVYASVYEPGSLPLVPYLIGRDGKTVTEALAEGSNLPLLTAAVA